MSNRPCPVGRTEAASLAQMNLRAVVTAGQVILIARPIADVQKRPRQGTVSPRYQPRNRLGQFISYAELQHALHDAEGRIHREATNRGPRARRRRQA